MYGIGIMLAVIYQTVAENHGCVCCNSALWWSEMNKTDAYTH